MKLNPLWKLLHEDFPRFNPLTIVILVLIINDLSNSSEKVSFRIFSDDTNTFFTSNNAKEVEFTMNEELNLVLKYCAVNKLSANLKKTNNYMLITSSEKKYTEISKILNVKTYIKYLGIYIDEHLQWEPQIQHVSNK